MNAKSNQSLILAMMISLAFLFLSPQGAFATEACSKVFVTALRYGDLKPSFKHNTNYKVKVPVTSEIKNQCALGTCHLHGWVSELESNYTAITGEQIKLSTDYLSARLWLMRSLRTLYNEKMDNTVDLGANVFDSRAVILKFGLVPDEAWTAPKNFKADPTSSRVNEYIQNIIANAKWEKDKEADPKIKKRIINRAEQQIRGIFENLVGDFPHEFVFHGKIYTPASFGAVYFPELTRPLVSITVDRRQNMPIRQWGSPSSVEITAPISSAEQAARDLLDRGLNVYLSYEHKKTFVDEKTGIMSIDAFFAPPSSHPLSYSMTQVFKSEPSGHAVQVVGYDYDPATGKVIKWKIKNSWGEKRGDQGYYHMYSDYFHAFVNGVSFFQESGIDLPKVEQKMPVQLKFDFGN